MASKHILENSDGNITDNLPIMKSNDGNFTSWRQQ